MKLSTIVTGSAGHFPKGTGRRVPQLFQAISKDKPALYFPANVARRQAGAGLWNYYVATPSNGGFRMDVFTTPKLKGILRNKKTGDIVSKPHVHTPDELCGNLSIFRMECQYAARNM